MTDVVLDASAILAYLYDEPGKSHVAQLLAGDCAASAVNLAEVAAKLTDQGMPPPSIWQAIDDLQLAIDPFALDAALASAALRTRTRPAGLSLGDRACLELGERLGVPVVTTDRVWTTLDLQVPVILARPE